MIFKRDWNVKMSFEHILTKKVYNLKTFSGHNNFQLECDWINANEMIFEWFSDEKFIMKSKNDSVNTVT